MTLTSMTGFGRAVVKNESVELECEARSINSRFLDLSFRLPPSYSALESQLSRIVREVIRRGRVEITVRRTAVAETPAGVQLNCQLFHQSITAVRELFKTEGLKEAGIQEVAAALLQRREILDFGAGQNDAADETAAVEECVRAAVADLRRMRLVEGAALETELGQILTRLCAGAERAREVSIADVPNIQARLRERVEKLLATTTLDEARFVQEAAFLAERADVTEELTRLRSHLTQLDECLKSGESGKKMEFLLQEIGREVNTTGSKSQSAELSRLAVEMKSELEKFREQVQNVE